MNRTAANLRAARVLAAATVVTLGLSGCSVAQKLGLGEDTHGEVIAADSAAAQLEITTPQVPAPAAVELGAPIEAPNLGEPVEDPGFGMSWQLMGVADDNGGLTVYVNARNNNDAPVAPESIPQPRLAWQDYAGNYVNAEPLQLDPEVLQTGLDLPLGPGATTTLEYVFQTSTSNMYAAEFQIANAVFRGNFNAIPKNQNKPE